MNREQEVLAVKLLGETIGYGNIDGITDFTAMNDASINDDGIVGVTIDMQNI